MGRTVAVIWHALFSILAGAAYFFFVLPRWWELTGETSHTLGTVVRIVVGALLGLAALPVVFTWLRTRRPEYGTPQLALRLRVCSIALHVLGGVLIIGAAISEIWFSLDDAGRWLFGIYGAAAAIGLLGVFSFYLSFLAELPPPPPKPLKKKERKSRWRRRKGEDEAAAKGADEAVETEEEDEGSPEKTWGDTESTADETEELQKPLAVEKSDEETVVAKTPAESTSEDDAPTAEAPRGGLRNRRPTGKIRGPRRSRKSDGGVAVED